MGVGGWAEILIGRMSRSTLRGRLHLSARISGWRSRRRVPRTFSFNEVHAADLATPPRGNTGQVVLVKVGHHNEPNEAVIWESPQQFVIGTTSKVDVTITGKMFALRLSSL